MTAFQRENVFEAWQYILSTYIFTSADYLVQPKYQQLLTDKVEAAGMAFEKHHFEASHSPFLSKTKDIVEILQ